MITLERALQLIAAQAEKILELEIASKEAKVSGDYWYGEFKKIKEVDEALETEAKTLREENERLRGQVEEFQEKPESKVSFELDPSEYGERITAIVKNIAKKKETVM